MTDKAIPKVVDFELARTLGPNEMLTDCVGMLEFCAPEVLLEQPYSYSCDDWSFGILLYFLFCGKFPFVHDDEE